MSANVTKSDYWSGGDGVYLAGEFYFHHDYILPVLDHVLGEANGRSLFEIGFGNGAVAHHMAEFGFAVTGVEPSRQGVERARTRYPTLTELRHGSLDDIVTADGGLFDVVLSLEVIEHLYAPRALARTAFSLLKPGGTFVVSTPYHGYLKNLPIAVAGKWDQHFDSLCDNGHIKFFSRQTISTLLTESGFSVLSINRAGRIPVLAKSMIVVARRPNE